MTETVAVTYKERPELNKILGSPARMLSSSKSTYVFNHPGDTVYFNACIFVEDGTEIWWGDINVTTESGALQNAANTLGETIYLTPELPFRFEGLINTRRDAYHARKIIEFKPEQQL